MKKGKEETKDIENKNKKLIAKWQFWVIIVLSIIVGIAIIACIVLGSIPRDKVSIDNKTLWISICCAVISADASIIVGVIAYWQSQKNSLLTIKYNIRIKIIEEKKAFLDNTSKIINYSLYTDFYSYLIFWDNYKNKNILQYKINVDKLIEYCQSYLLTIQGLEYITESFKNISEKVIEMMKFIDVEYYPAKNFYGNDKELDVRFNKIKGYVENWLNEMARLRNKVYKEYNTLIEAIENCDNINAIDNINKKALELSKKIILDINIALKKEIKKLEKETQNGQAKDDVNGQDK